MSIIDCRFRPTTPEFMCYIEPEPKLFSITKARPVKPESFERSIEVMKSMGITGAMVSGRDMGSVGGDVIPNEYIASLVKKHSDFNVIGVAGVDPLKSEQEITENLENSIKNLGLKGVSVDPFTIEADAGDKRLYPIYELCQDLNVPVVITVGPLPIGRGYMEWGSPLTADRVASDFPNLKILLSHAGFPYTQELIAIVWRQKNVYFENSIYRHLPGANLVVEAVNTVLQDKFVYASAAPYADYSQALPKFLDMGFKNRILPKILHENAERLFNL